MTLHVLSLVGRWYWIVLGLILGLLSAFYYLAKTPQQYTATSSLLIKQQTRTPMSRDQVDEIDLRSTEAMNTIVALIQSKELLERVASLPEIRELNGLIQPPVDLMPTWLRRLRGTAAPRGVPWQVPPPAELARQIKGWLGVSIVRGTRLINISTTHPMPAVASVIADTIANEYVAMISATSIQDRSESIGLLEKQAEEARTSLRTVGRLLAIYAGAVEATKVLGEQEAEVATLQRRYLPKHPKLVAATVELTHRQQEFIREFDAARQATGGQSAWEPAWRELPDVQSQTAEYLHTASQDLRAYVSVLESENKSSTIVFNSMLTQIQESSVNQHAADVSSKVSERANAFEVPTGLDSKKILQTGALGGLVAGLLLAFIFIRLDQRFHTVAQIARETGAPVLGAIAEISPRHLAISENLYRKRHPEVELHGAEDKLLVFRPGASSTSYAEMYRSLYASVTRLGEGSQHKISLFTSAVPGEGKTLTSVNFAAAAARQGRKTLLIDLDLRKPAIHKVFGLPREPDRGGITECLTNLASFDQVIQRPVGHPNLSLIVSGKNSANPGELLESDVLTTILAQACRDFDVVVLDSAPFLAVSDTRIIARLVHNFCFVARANYVSKGAVRRVLEIVKEDGLSLSGILLNSYKEHGYLRGQNYSYGYYRSAGYGRFSRYAYDTYGAPGKAVA